MWKYVVRAKRRTSRGLLCDALVALGAAFAALAVAPAAHAVPSYTRQMQVPCNTCHTQFPELNAFGRQFKLTGYTLAAGTQVQAQDESKKTTLDLGSLPPIAVMLQAAYTQTGAPLPDTQNNDFQLPQQLSVFLAGKIAPKLGSFLQLTYSQADDKFGMDNAEIRFADSAMLSGRPVTYGVTLNNSPGVEDLWNSTPVWGFPWAGPDSPGPAAATLIDGQLSQDVAGVGAFAFFNSKIYAATTLYRSAHLGADAPTFGSENTIDSAAPYWRVAWQHSMKSSYLEVGAYGMRAKLIPEGVSGATDQYRDTAVDFQYETVLHDRQVRFHGTAIHESRTLDATFAAGNSVNRSGGLDTVRFDGSLYRNAWRYTLGYFSTDGDSDPGLYAPAEVDGSASGTPDSRGWIAQATYSPWQNVQLMLQYTAYGKFNGARTDYDGFGRDAADNNALFLQGWFVW